MLGLIAGQGALPLAIARSARSQGRRVVAVALRELAAPELTSLVERVHWLAPGEVSGALHALLDSGVREVVLAGKVPKLALLGGSEAALALDPLARRELARLPDRRDASILRRAVEGLEAAGLRVLSQRELIPELVAGAGALGRLAPSAAQQRDIALGLPIARALAELDVGQTVAMKDGAVLAVEAIEGTDAAIQRAGLFSPGATVIKVARPQQDPRFDLPAVGPDTLAALRAARAGCLAVEAGSTLLLERELLCQQADQSGIALVGVVVGTHRNARGGSAA